MVLNGGEGSPSPANAGAPDRRDDDLEIIEQLLALALEAIDRKTPDVRLADILKLLEFKHRLKPQSDVRAIFWEWIERFRQDAARDQKKHKRRSKVVSGKTDDNTRPVLPGEEVKK